MRFRRASFSPSLAALRLALVVATFAVALVPPTHAAAGAAAPVAPKPEVSVSLRGSLDGTVEVGEPLFIAVRLDSPDTTGKLIAVAPAGKRWADGLAVELTASGDSKVLARGRVVPGSASPDSVLDEEHPLSAVWWFSASDLRELGAGAYVLRALANATSEPSDQSSGAESAPLEFQIVAPSQSRDRVIQRTIALAAAAQIEGATSKAVAFLDEFLARDPDASPVLIARADFALSTGDVDAAAVCAYRAKELETRGTGEPSIALHELITNVQRALADNPSPQAPVVPGALPASVRAPVQKPKTTTAQPGESQTASPAVGK